MQAKFVDKITNEVKERAYVSEGSKYNHKL